MQVYKSKFAKAFFYSDKSLFSVYWSDPRQKMTDDSFKKTILEYIKIIEELKPRLFLFDASSLFFPVDPELQVWMNENSLAKTSNIVYKEAVVVSEDMIMVLSAEQTLETEDIRKNSRKIFHDKEKALEWLMNE